MCQSRVTQEQDERKGLVKARTGTLSTWDVNSWSIPYQARLLPAPPPEEPLAGTIAAGERRRPVQAGRQTRGPPPRRLRSERPGSCNPFPHATNSHREGPRWEARSSSPPGGFGHTQVTRGTKGQKPKAEHLGTARRHTQPKDRAPCGSTEQRAPEAARPARHPPPGSPPPPPSRPAAPPSASAGKPAASRRGLALPCSLESPRPWPGVSANATAAPSFFPSRHAPRLLRGEGNCNCHSLTRTRLRTLGPAHGLRTRSGGAGSEGPEAAGPWPWTASLSLNLAARPRLDGAGAPPARAALRGGPRPAHCGPSNHIRDSAAPLPG
ncbi:translation initiation factor IF-2-like [Moschus berezovskii]|uniref:translation initiation factor IF-2-like n=1 Tax=Moschus berezovskii TaxID=68408 RepID=UPI0024448E8B|nr:translation initiation factor IF-2-like [Moschus berezovskii]